MRGGDLSIKAPLAILALIVGLIVYRMQYPPTTLAADGSDPDWDAAVQHSLDLSRPTVVLFTATWCPGCQRLHGNVLSRDDVQDELQNHYSFYTVDLTHPSPQAQARARKFRVSSIPLMIRYDANGKETDRTNYLEPGQMIAWLKAGE